MNLVWCVWSWFKAFRDSSRPLSLGLIFLLTGSVPIFADSPQAHDQIRVRRNNSIVERVAGPKYHPTRLLVRYKPGTSPEKMHAVHEGIGAKVLRELRLVRGLQLVQLSGGVSIQQALAHYRKDASVLYAEPDYILHIVGAPNDPDFPSQWSLQNTGQNGGTPGADIHAVQAWSLTTGSPNVVVGVIDTGVDYNHQDLAANIWTASSGYSVTASNGTTLQCGVGSHGFNMVADTCDPMDDNGHGSHVSGTIGAVGNNGVGVIGINWQVQVLPCKFLDSTGSGSTDNAIACLNFMKELKDSGINIIVTNNSWGGADSSQALHDAIAAAMQDGMLFVAAAGNDFSDNDEFPTYPATFYLPNVLAVAATDRTDTIVTFSNTGRHTVHIAAPGRDILSTTPNNTYSYDSGTSMAAPHVTGVAALLKAQNPSLDWRGIKNLILSGGDAIPSAQSTTMSQKRLDAYGALTCSSGKVGSRLLPIPEVISGSVGTPVTLAYLNVDCGQPAGGVTVSVTPGNQTLTLVDDGTGQDLAANDGIYTGQWTPSQPGNYTLSFPDGSSASVQVLTSYGYSQTTYTYRVIIGTNLNLGDDAVATLTSPFPIAFGGGSFNTLYVSSNGTVSFTNPFDGYQDFPFTPGNLSGNETFPSTLLAPMWEDLYPLKGTNQNVFWSVTGSAPNRELVIEWRNVPVYPCRSDKRASVTFQAVFDEGSSNVLFNYSDVIFGDACSYLDYGQNATVGILPSPNEGVVWGDGSGPSLSNGLALLWQTPPPTAGSNPTPTLTSISPSTIPLFSPDTTITVAGTNFVPGSVVQWENTNLEPLPPGINLPTTYVSGTQLTAILPSAFSAPYSRYVVGTVQSILVSNPGNAGSSSNTLPISIVYPGRPSITSLSPSSASAGDFSLYMDVKGTNLWGAVIYWNGSMLFSTQISNTEAYAAVPSSLLTTAGTAQVTAVANVPNGGTSIAVPFTIGTAAAPAAGAAQSPALQSAQHQPVDSGGTAEANSGARVPRPVRFFGWNYGKQEGGPAYLKYFSRPYGGPVVSPHATLGISAKAMTVPNTSANPQLSLSQPSGLPGFAFHPALPAGFLPTSVTTGDFNRDGKMDWVVSNGGSNDLWIYFGNGDDTAQLPKIIRLTGAAPVQVVAADLRKIGVLDLIVAEADSQTIGVLLGNGDGTFQPEVTYFVQGPPLSLAVGDVNGDGKPDVVVGVFGGGNIAGPLVTLLGDGAGKLGTPLPTPSIDDIGFYFTTTVVLKDLNGDGLLDALVIDQGGVVPGAHSYLSVGDGTFKHADYFFESADFILVTNVAVGDLDGDGCADAVTVEALGVVRIFKGTCDGNFQGFPNVLTLGAGEAPVSVALADMNGDGHLDIITGGGFFGVAPGYGEEASNLVTVLLGDGTGNFALPKVYRAEPSLYGLAVADLNGDGKPEVIVASQDTDKAVVLRNDGQGNLDGPGGGYVGYITGGQQAAVNAPISNFLVRDLNGDGKPDLAFIEAEPTYSSPFELAVLLNDGTGHFGPPARTAITDFLSPPSGYVVGDFRNTGHIDMVISSGSFQNDLPVSLTFLANNGAGAFAKASVTTIPATQISHMAVGVTGDFNGDGKLDMVGTGNVPGANNWGLITLLGNGDGTFRVGTFSPSGLTSPPFMIFVGDYNRDGKLDVLVWVYDNVVGTQNHNVYEFLGNGDGTFSAPKLILPNFGFFGMADLNHDGYPDIVEFNQIEAAAPVSLDTPSFTVYIGQPDGTFQQGQTYSVYSGLVYPGYGFSNVGPSQALTPMLADFNGDGNIDVGVVQMTPYPNARSYLQVLAGNGDGTFTPTYEITPFDKFGLPVNAADVNGDGRADLLELDGWPSSYHVIPGIPGPTVQLALASQPIVGNTGTLQVNLSLVPSSATTVQLSASDPNIQIPASVSIPAGTLGTTVHFTLSANFDSTHVFSLSALLSGQTTTIYSYQTLKSLAGIHLFTNATKESTPPGGTTHDYAIGVISVGGYSATVQLSCLGLPNGAFCQFGTNPLLVSAGQSVGSSLTIQTTSSTPTGMYKITVAATDGAVFDQLPLTLNIADFSLSVTPGSVSVLSGAAADFTLQITTNSGWTDIVNVSCALAGTTQGECTAGGTYLIENSPFQVLTSGITAGDYTINISGSADGITHTASAVLHIQGASGTVSPTSATVSVGSSTNFNITLNSQNGYSDQFTLSCPAAPVELTCTFAPPSGTLPGAGSLTSLLTVKVNAMPAAVPILPEDPRMRWLPIALFMILGTNLSLALWAWRNKPQPGLAWKWATKLNAASLAGILLLSVTSCGGGGGSSGTNPPPPPPQPTTVTLSVQAASPTLTVNVGTITLKVK
jgi:subtilisin family serine protease